MPCSTRLIAEFSEKRSENLTIFGMFSDKSNYIDVLYVHYCCVVCTLLLYCKYWLYQQVVLRGPLRVVNDCVMLTRGCVEVLGGHVEELMENYNQTAVLQQLL